MNEVQDASTDAESSGRLRGTLGQAVLGSLLMWLALPPCDLWPLAWIAPVPWLLLIHREHLIGRRPYRAVWLAGFLFWLLAVHWLRLPHPATHLGWLALSFYLAFYLPLFVGVSRVAVHQFRMPLVLAAPIVWTGLEYARAHLLSGFLMAALGHTQYRWIELIQISDLAGGYAVSFLVMFVAACLAQTWLAVVDRPSAGRWRFWPLAAAALLMVTTLAYGRARLHDSPNRDSAEQDGPVVALIQGNIEADWKSDPEKQQRIFDDYLRLSQAASAQAGRLDLIIWPETMFRQPIVERADNAEPFGKQGNEMAAVTPQVIHDLAQLLDSPLLLGLVAMRYHSPDDIDRFNSAQAVDRQGSLVDRYDKMHLVMFGEYVPFAQWMPWLYRLTPLGGGLASGDAAMSVEIEGVRYAPSICFETVMPHLLRRQVRELADVGREPDVLVNLTNDAWFWGSSELDMHLVCGVFRAVETRKPLLIAANAGVSASIDSDGRVRSHGPKQDEATLVAQVVLDPRDSRYLAWGDWPAGICLLATIGWAAAGWYRKRRKPLT